VRGRSVVVLVLIAAAVAGLGAFRASRRAPADAPPADDAAAPDARARPALLDFGRGTCVPCKQMMPVLDELAQRHAERVDVRYLDLADAANQARAEELGVHVIPTQVLLAADGSVVGRHEGFWALEEVEARFAELGWTSPQ